MCIVKMRCFWFLSNSSIWLPTIVMYISVTCFHGKIMQLNKTKLSSSLKPNRFIKVSSNMFVESVVSDSEY